MPRSKATTPRTWGQVKASGSLSASKTESRYTVGLEPDLALQVRQYAENVDLSISRAIAALVRLGLARESRKREFLSKLKANLANDDPAQQEQLTDEFRTLILGH